MSGFSPIQHWCSYEEGLLRWNAQDQTVESIRLPVLSSAGGFGTMPQLLLAFGGQDAPFEVENSSMLISQRLNVLDLPEDEADFWLKGLIPYAFGDDTAYRLTNAGYYTDIDGLEGLSELDGVVLGLVSLTDAERLASAAENERNLLVLTSLDGNSSSTAITVQSWFDEQATGSDLNLNVQAVKIEAAAMAAESSGVLAAMFLVFGSFTIAAGVLLVLTIVLMLAEARRSEFGTLRSIGLSQSDARTCRDGGGAGRERISCTWFGSWTWFSVVHQHWIPTNVQFSWIWPIRIQMDIGFRLCWMGLGLFAGNAHPLVHRCVDGTNQYCGGIKGWS